MTRGQDEIRRHERAAAERDVGRVAVQRGAEGNDAALLLLDGAHGDGVGKGGAGGHATAEANREKKRGSGYPRDGVTLHHALTESLHRESLLLLTSL